MTTPSSNSTLNKFVQELQSFPGIRISIEYNGSALPADHELANFDAWARVWLETYKKGIVKDNSYDGTVRNPVEVHLIPHFGNRLLSSITPTDVQLYFKALADRLSLETQKKIRNVLRAIFDTAIECSICNRNPVTRNLRLVCHLPLAEKKTWTAEQYAIAFQFALQHVHGLAIITLMETAMSRSELLGLCWTDLDVDSCSLTLQNGLVSQKSTVTNRYTLVHNGLKNKYRKRCQRQ